MQALLALGVWAAVACISHAQFKSKRVNNPDIPATSFSCVGRHNGYYADVDTDCQVYHMCLDRQQFSYQCPNTTRFQQRMMVCDHWYQVDCPSAPLSYSANLLIGQRDKLFVEDDEHRDLQEASVRTSKGLLKGLSNKGLSSQPAANALDRGVDSNGVDGSPRGKPFAGNALPPRVTPAPPSSALELPFEDDEDQPKRGSFFQRSPTSSFAQPFQNQLLPSSSTPPPPPPSPSPSAPALSFTFSPPHTPEPPRFSISFSPSPSFPASGHNLQRPQSPSPAPSAAATPSAPAQAPSTFIPSAPAPSAPSPSAPTQTFSPSTPAPNTFPPSAPSPSTFVPSAPDSNSFAPSTFIPSAPASNSFAPSTFVPSAPASNLFAPSTFVPSAPSPTTFPSSASSQSTFFPSAPSASPFPFRVKVPSRELEAPDIPEANGNDLPSSGPFPSSAPSSFAESMTPQQTSSFASPFPVRSAPAPPSRELTPPHFDAATAASGPSASGSSASGPSAPGQLGASGSASSGPGGFPRSFSLFNSTQRFSLFAATAAPSFAPSSTPSSTPSPAPSPAPSVTPPSRELEAPPVDEGEVDYNTVELRYQDTRRLFFIPTGNDDASGKGGGPHAAGDASDPVVVIKYPSKTARGASGSTAHLKSSSEDVRRRVNPTCPSCHPDFVVPGTCRPCVLLR